jgi:hypothetical protein
MPLFQYFGWVAGFFYRSAPCRELVLLRTD